MRCVVRTANGDTAETAVRSDTVTVACCTRIIPRAVTLTLVTPMTTATGYVLHTKITATIPANPLRATRITKPIPAAAIAITRARVRSCITSIVHIRISILLAYLRNPHTLLYACARMRVTKGLI